MKNQITLDQQDARAAEMLEASDVRELHALYLTARKDGDDLADALSTIVNHYAGSSKEPRGTVSPNAIEAMRDVALAAIALASTSLARPDAEAGAP